MNPRKRKARQWLMVAGGSAVLAVGGYFSTRYYLWPAFKAHRLEKINQEGQAFLLAHDYSNALLTARKGLQTSIHNPGAWQLAAAAAEAQELPEAVFYQDSLAHEVPSKENYLKVMRMAVHFDVPEYGLTALKSVGESGRSDVEFHRLAAELYQRTGQLVAAKFELYALTQLDPADEKAALELAQLELAADPQGRDRALRPRILALSARPGLHDQALLLLLAENLRLKRTSGTADLVAQLQTNPLLPLASQLMVLQAEILLGQPGTSARLLAVQAENRENPVAVAALVEFLIATGAGAQAPDWVASLSDKVRADPGVEHMVAEALLKQGNSVALARYLEPLDWKANEFLRQALLAHAYRDQGRSANFESAWRLAVIAASTDIRRASALLARADEWRWVTERYGVVWKLFNLAPTNESLQGVLATWERHQGNTVNLNRLFARIIEVQPNNDDAKNNFAYTSLLLDSNISRASLIAAKLVQEKPTNPYYVTTNALAYYKQGDARAALAHLDTLGVADRSQPLRMMFRGLFLAAEGQVGPATDLVNGVHLEGMLPEEKHLVGVAIAAIAEVDRMNGYRSRLVAFHRGQGADAAASGWLALVSSATRLQATADMELADSLYAAPDWNGLRDLLNATDWKDHEYLRVALRAYVLRQQGSSVEGRDQWEQAMALAGSDNSRLQNLRALATFWGWTPERIEALNHLFRNTPGDHVLVAELMQYYRAERRTPDLMRVLAGYTAGAPEAVDEAVLETYYGLLLGSNEAQGHVLAQRAFLASPQNLERRMVYALSLWRQNRAAEAIALFGGLSASETSTSVSVPLVKAIIFAQLGQAEAARACLGQLDEQNALPEEAALARRIEQELANQDKAAARPPVT